MPPIALIEQVFHEALALPESQDRREWLVRRCGDGTPLYAEVESLLAAHRAAAGRPAVAETRPLPTVPDELFGAYRPIRLLGRGGMSAVYLAERADGRFDLKVAVKVMAAHLAGEDFLRRFHTEGQFLAALQHPGITALLDGGVSASGHPYLIVEHVEGEALDRYCNDRRLGVEARLGLFLQVCQAVDYAHRSLILHRDLKPANILVTSGGVVKLLDFGTAALLSDVRAVTATRARMLTPRYASPEQLRGDRQGVASDVFSLGVILYELLTGDWPFGDANSLLTELKRATGEAAAAPPALEGDLSAITLKALESEPARRYGAVSELAADIGCFLDGRPVTARARTPLYRAGKFLRRRWLAAAAAAIFIAGLSGATALALRQARIAGAEAQRARDEARKSARVTAFLRGMLSSGAQAGGTDVTVIQMLNAAEPGIEKSWKDDPLAEATLRASLGTSYVTLMQPERARQQLEQALALFQRLGRHADAADTLLVLGINAQGRDEWPAGAAAYYRRSLEELRLAGKGAPPALAFRVRVYLAGVLFWGVHNMPEARQLADEALSAAAAGVKVSSDLMAAALTYRGLILVEEGRFDEGEGVLRQATGANNNAFDAWVGLAHSRYLRNDLAGAREFARHDYEIAAKYGVDDVAEAGIEWARYRSFLGEGADAVAPVRSGLPLMRKNYQGARLGYWLEAAAGVLNRAGRYQEGSLLAHEAGSVLDSSGIPEGHPLRAASLEDEGGALQGMKRNREALPLLERSAAIYRQLGRAYAPQAGRVDASLAAARNAGR